MSTSRLSSKANKTTSAQIKLVGSEAIYKRIDIKMTNLKIDPFFYIQQLKLYSLRKLILETIFHDQNEDLLGFLATQGFDQFLQNVEDDNTSLDVWFQYTGVVSWAEITRISTKARTKFQIPNSALLLLLNPCHTHPDQPAARKCTCKQGNHCVCNEAQLSELKAFLAPYPEAAELTRLAILSLGAPSLGEMCMKRVVELGLPQDGLPGTLREMLETGPGQRRGAGWQEEMVALL